MVTKILEFLASIVVAIINAAGYWGIGIAMAIESACIPLPSEIIMPFSGYLISEGRFQIFWVVVAGTLGNLVGSIIAYWVGLIGGRPFILKYGKYILMTRHDMDVAERWFNKYGDLTIFFTRNMPVIRTFISLPAGIAKMNFLKFCLYTTLGSVPWNIALTYFGMIFGAKWHSTLSPIFHKFDVLIGICIIILLYIFIKRHLHHRSSE
ncbi:MAG: DedA family protein [bacterium]